MGRRRKKNSLARIFQNQAEGRGQSIDGIYKPGIYTYEIASKGKTARVPGATAGRVHHCLSQHEKDFLSALDHDRFVTEIMEQYMLPLEDTLLIAARMGIKHPEADGCPAQMSTDFYYRRNGKWYAAAIKTTEDLEKKRTREKLQIEEEYWKSQDVPWKVVTEKDISRQLAVNLRWLYSGEPLDTLLPDPEFRKNLEEAFLELYGNYEIPFSEIIDTTEKYCRLRPGTMLQVFKYLVCEGRIQLDLMKPINTDEPRKYTGTEYGKEKKHADLCNTEKSAHSVPDRQSSLPDPVPAAG